MIEREGYVKLHRRLLEWEWFGDSSTMHVLLCLLLNANWKEGRWLGHVIPPGSVVTSREKIAAQTGLTEKQVRRALDNLEQGRVIERDRAGKGQLVTLVNWAKYQVADETGADKGPATGPRKGQPLGRQRAGIEEGKEGKKGKKKRTPEGVLAGEPQLPLDVPEASRTEDPPAPPADRRDPDVQAVVEYLTSQLQAKGIAQSLDRTWIRTKGGREIDANRADARHLLQRLAKDYPRHDPVESARRLINLALSSDFYAPKCTTVGYLYRKMSEIIASSKRTTTNGSTRPQQGLADKANGALQILLAGAVPAGDPGGSDSDPIAAEPGA